MVMPSALATVESEVLASNLQCPECRQITTQCCECGQWTSQCECPELEDAYCLSCSVIFQAEEADDEEWMDESAECDCHIRYTDNLICDECDVYRLSVNDPWQWKGRDNTPLKCFHDEEYYCDKCGIERASIYDEWDYIKGAKVWRHYKCRHYNSELKFPDGVSVFASSRFNRDADEDAPDFGIYLDGLWYASCPAYFIDWPDYGLPTRWEVSARCIIDAYKKASDGLWVEVGCIGGHGRTGTVLACMGILSGMSAAEAIEYVHMFYCTQAIESDEQEWYVEWFNAYVNGGTTEVKTSFILGKRPEKGQPDEVHEFQYVGIVNWRETEMITASGQRPLSRTELSKSKHVTIPDENDDTEPLGEGKVYPYCDICNMVGKCLCKSDSSKAAAQVDRLVNAYTGKARDEYEATWEYNKADPANQYDPNEFPF